MDIGPISEDHGEDSVMIQGGNPSSREHGRHIIITSCVRS